MSYKFSSTSRAKLASCELDLQRLFSEVIKDTDCTILEGHRTLSRQKILFDEGRSKTMNSNHLSDPSKAVDVMEYPIDWGDYGRQAEFAQKVLDKASEMGIKVRWGGHFKSFYDAPHWELKGE